MKQQLLEQCECCMGGHCGMLQTPDAGFVCLHSVEAVVIALHPATQRLIHFLRNHVATWLSNSISKTMKMTKLKATGAEMRQNRRKTQWTQKKEGQRNQKSI